MASVITEHQGIISEELFISAGVKMIQEMGAEMYLTLLFKNLRDVGDGADIPYGYEIG